jgi:prepilin-type N-terminal cleavage/methylation domain-containing protein
MRPASRTTNAGFTLIELMIVVAILAILAVTAVPAFVKYMRRARTTEAVDQLDKLTKGAAFYYTAKHITPGDGAMAPCQFPAAQAVTPSAGTCCASIDASVDTDDDGRCDPNPSAWNVGSWPSLTFQLNDAHYFVYGFDSSGVRHEAMFTATAHADLDCDGEQSTFQRIGFGDPQATDAECAMYGSAAFFVDSETE